MKAVRREIQDWHKAQYKEDGGVQVRCLIHVMGNESESIYQSFAFAEDRHRNDSDKVIEKFDKYFVPRRNIIHKCACFLSGCREKGHKAETFIRALYELSEHCEFGTSRDENIRDQIAANKGPDTTADCGDSQSV